MRSIPTRKRSEDDLGALRSRARKGAVAAARACTGRPQDPWLARFPSGQRGQTVNLLAQPSQVRILVSPPFPTQPRGSPPAHCDGRLLSGATRSRLTGFFVRPAPLPALWSVAQSLTGHCGATFANPDSGVGPSLALLCKSASGNGLM